jgi:hypothetical protein
MKGFRQTRRPLTKMLRQVFLAACVASAAAFAPAALPTATRRASAVNGEARARPFLPADARRRVQVPQAPQLDVVGAMRLLEHSMAMWGGRGATRGDAGGCRARGGLAAGMRGGRIPVHCP